MNSNILIALAVSAGIMATMPAAWAGNGNKEGGEITALQSARISAEQAAQAAAAQAGGKVSSVQIYEESGKAAYHVEVVGSDGKQHDLSVDATTGDVTQMAANQDDDQDGDENEGADGSQE